MTGEGNPHPLYAKARTALLDALEALQPHVPALTLVGAQAVYMHVGEGDLAIAPFTTDADLGVDPRILGNTPPALSELLGRHGFQPGEHPAVWLARNGAQVDLLVAEALAGGGRRGARLGFPHGKAAAMKSRGLEAALVDFEAREIPSLEPEKDSRSVRLKVAGSGALLVAKLTKIGERVAAVAAATPGSGEAIRAARRFHETAKDALDVFRLLRLDTESLATRIEISLRDDVAREVTRAAIRELRSLFSLPESEGCSLLERAVGVPSSPGGPMHEHSMEVYQCVALAGDLLEVLRS